MMIEMKPFRLDNSPVVYYKLDEKCAEWLLFLHAAFVNHEMFQKQFDYFAGKYNILLPDIIGHGRSTDTKKGDSLDNMSDWIHDILKKEKIEKIHIVGVSLGAVLAQDFANRYPGSIQSLACFGGYDINNFDKTMQGKNTVAQMLMMAKALFSIKWFAQANKKISAYSTQAQNDFYDMNIRFPKKSFMYLASLNGMVNAHQTKKRDYPLLIGCGAHDIPMELQAVKSWKKSEPDCEVVIFDNAGHCVNMDVPQEFNRVMEMFWAGVERR
ncbi:MAG: alpha/beta hydrolase [Bacillus sp. (in: Bacteria)]|nr:alpha/beta hydrolase [Bacillus sp. (in: firmicutes)]MCM1427176.1 alpha/beta hydrolase [Eubacterium sp.]